MLNRVFRVIAATIGLALALPIVLPTLAQAQGWPTKAVRFIVPLGPGSGVDISARLFADRLSKKWNQSVVVENQPGGDAIIAINAFLSANDSHVLLIAPASVRKKRGIDLGIVESGHRPTVEAERARRQHEIGALQRAVAQRRGGDFRLRSAFLRASAAHVS